MHSLSTIITICVTIFVLQLIPTTKVLAQTLVTDPESGLEYLDDGDGILYIDVSSNPITTINGKGSNVYFVSDSGLRPQWRQQLNSNNGKWYKTDLDAITSINVGNNMPKTYKGIEYFRNLETLVIPGNNIQNLDLDLSGNKKLTSLSFTSTNKSPTIAYLDISNTLLTNISFLSQTNSTQTLTTFRCDNTELTGPVNLGAYTKLSYVSYENSNLTEGTTLLLPTNFYQNIQELTIDVSEEEHQSVDVSHYTNLRKLTVIGATELVLPAGRTTFTLDVSGSPAVANVDLSAQTSLTSLTLTGATGLTLPTLTSTMFSINTLGSPGLVIDMTGQTALQHLTCKCDGYLTLSADNTALTYLDVSQSELKDLDLSNGQAPNLTTVNCYEAPIKNLYLQNHTALTTLRIHPEQNNQRYYNAKNVLEKINITGCSALTQLVVTNASQSEWTYEFCSVKEIIAENCTSLTLLQCQNGLLNHLDVRGCSSLEKIAVSQNYLDDNIDLNGCGNLKIFIAHRNKFKNLDFLLKTTAEGGTRASIANINLLEQIQVNGGSYVVMDKQEDGTVIPLVREKFTNVITNIHTAHLDPDHMRMLLCADNLLQTLNISHLTKLTYLQCENNMLLTLDLSNLPTTAVTHADNVTRTLNENCQWGYKYGQVQVGFLETEIVKGIPEDGSKDLIAIHLPNGSYSYTMNGETNPDDKAYLWEKVSDARQYLRYLTSGNPKDESLNNTANALDSESDIRMRTIQEIAAAEGLCPTGHTGEHLIIHSVREILQTVASGRWALDQDLYGRILTYRYNTLPESVRQNEGREDIAGLSPYIFIRAHIYPYIMYVNPATKDSEGNRTGADYYSGTICLDYDALIPDGVTVWIATGVKNREAMTSSQTADWVEQQLNLVHVGGGKNANNEDMPIIIPANTPVYVKSETKAGLYAFQKVWDFAYHGWEDYRQDINTVIAYKRQQGTLGEDEDLLPLLHGVEDDDHKSYKPQYDPQTHPELWITAEALSGNILQGTLQNTPVTPNTVLTLGREDLKGITKIGFWPYRGREIPAHRCYLDMSVLNDNNATKGLTFFFDDGNNLLTGINEQLQAPAQLYDADTYYTVQGVRLNGKPATPGIYIRNGKKQLIR